jgi:hypothetical protein
MPDGATQRTDGAFASVSVSDPDAEIALAMRILGALDDTRTLHLPSVERACAYFGSVQASDGSWGGSGAGEDERIFATGMLAGHFGKTRFASAAMLNGAADFLADRFTPERVQGFVWHPIAAYAHVFANVPHDDGDAVLQWTGRELERGFRTGRFDAVRTARVMLLCDSPSLPGARLDSGEVIAQVLTEQMADGGWLRPEDPSPEARVRHSLDALAALVRFGRSRDARGDSSSG